MIEHFKKDEAQMNEEISSRKSHVPIIDFDERTYKVDSTGATISAVSSVSLLHRYCSKLPHDEYDLILILLSTMHSDFVISYIGCEGKFRMVYTWGRWTPLATWVNYFPKRGQSC